MPDLTGISRATWSNYETGETEPDLEKLVRISKFFGVGLSDLIEVDLSVKGNLIEKTVAKDETNNGNLKGNRKGNPIDKSTQDVQAVYGRNEKEDTAFYYLLKEMKDMSEKFDKLRDSIENKGH